MHNLLGSNIGVMLILGDLVKDIILQGMKHEEINLTRFGLTKS